MFGTQAIRLIREAWGGVITPDAQGVSKERGAQQLAQELYAMFDDNIPLTQNAPLTLNNGSTDSSVLTINNGGNGNSLAINGGNMEFGGNGSVSFDGSGFNAGGRGGITVFGPDFGSGPGSGPLVDKFPAFPGRPGITIGDPTTPITIGGRDFTGGGGGSDAAATASTTSVFLGRVVSGGGNAYQVDLFGDGSAMPATATVAATVPQILASETIDAGTWIAAVHRFSVATTDGSIVVSYEFQPPIWM